MKPFYKNSFISALVLWSVFIYPLSAFAGSSARHIQRVFEPMVGAKNVRRDIKPRTFFVDDPPEIKKAIMNPDSIEQGRSVPINITFPQCELAWGTGKKFTLEAADAAALAQNGIQITDMQSIVTTRANEKCTAFAQISVAKATPAGTYSYKLGVEDIAGTTHQILLRVTGITGLPPGPVPPGLDPPQQVDVMWGVVPSKIVRDNFGQRIARNFYCLEVIIGNNSGYDLQVSAVGFRSGPVGEYANAMAAFHQKMGEMQKTRAVSTSEQMKSIIDNCPQENYAQCVEQGTRPILDRLRAQSIAELETTQIMADRGAEASKTIYSNILPVTSYPMARGTASRGEFWSVRNWTTRLLAALGPIAIGITPFFSVKNQKDYSNAINLFTNPISEGLSNFWPDEFIPQLQRLDDQILRQGRIITNNRQEVTAVFVPKKILQIEKKYIDDPRIISMALGKLVLIGNQIQYLNRVSVTSNPDDGQIKGRPVINRTFRNEFAVGTAGSLSLTGASLEGAVIRSSDPAITIDSIDASRTGVSARITVTPQARPGIHTLILSTTGGSESFDIIVLPPIPDVSGNPPEYITHPETDAEPASGRPVSQDFGFRINGTNLLNAELLPVRSNENFVVAIDRTNSDTTTLTGTVTVPKMTAVTTPGNEHTFRLVNSNPLSRTGGRLIGFAVTKPASPTINPSQGVVFAAGNEARVNLSKDREIPFTINGTNLTFARDIVPSTNARRPQVNCLRPVTPSTAENSNTRIPCTLTIKKDLEIEGTDDTFDYEIVDGNDQKVKFPIKILPARKISVTAPSGDQQIGNPIKLTGSNLDGVSLASPEDPNWNVEITARAAGEFTIKVTRKNNADANAPMQTTVKFSNSDGSTTDDLVIRLVAPPSPTPSP